MGGVGWMRRFGSKRELACREGMVTCVIWGCRDVCYLSLVQCKKREASCLIGSKADGNSKKSTSGQSPAQPCHALPCPGPAWCEAGPQLLLHKVGLYGVRCVEDPHRHTRGGSGLSLQHFALGIWRQMR